MTDNHFASLALYKDRSAPIMVSLPNGSKANINTTEGTNAFLEGTPNFLHFSSNLKEIRKLRSKKRLNKRQQTQLFELYQSINCIAKNADRDIFATNIPQSEIQDLLNYIVEEIKSFTKDEHWISSGALSYPDCIVLYLCINMFRHGIPISLAFESDFFQTLATFLGAWKGIGSNFKLTGVGGLFIGKIMVQTLVFAYIHNNWSTEKILRRFEANGLLQQNVRCLGVMILTEESKGVQDLLNIVFTELQSCPGIVSRMFKIGEQSGDLLAHYVQEWFSNIQPDLLGTLKGITSLVETMDSTEFEAKLESGACSYCSKKFTDSKLKSCARCDFIFYCSRECQKADWKSHQCNCRKLSRDALDRLFSLRMNIVRFMNQHHQTITEAMDHLRYLRESGVLAVEISFMPDENGDIPAFQDPPDFGITWVDKYETEFPAWFLYSDWAIDLQLTWLNDLVKAIETEDKSTFGTLVIYHAGRIHVDVGTMEQYHHAASSLEDIQMNLGTNYWCSPPISVLQKHPDLEGFQECSD